jgi:hypothetical protein
MPEVPGSEFLSPIPALAAPLATVPVRFPPSLRES